MNLPIKQRKAAQWLASGSSVAEAARQVGVTVRTVFRWRQDPDFQRFIETTRQEKESLRTQAEAVMERAMAGDDISSLQLKAAQDTLRLAPGNLSADPGPESILPIEKSDGDLWLEEWLALPLEVRRLKNLAELVAYGRRDGEKLNISRLALDLNCTEAEMVEIMATDDFKEELEMLKEFVALEARAEGTAEPYQIEGPCPLCGREPQSQAKTPPDAPDVSNL